MRTRVWMTLTVIIVWTISSLYFFGDSIYSNVTAQKFIEASKKTTTTLSIPKPPPRSLKNENKQKPPPPVIRNKYVIVPNRDIYGRCDLGDRPVLMSKAEQTCERDPLCKGFVEVEGMTYLKSCVDADSGFKSGRTLYIHQKYYTDSALSRETPNLRTGAEHRATIGMSSSVKLNRPLEMLTRPTSSVAHVTTAAPPPAKIVIVRGERNTGTNLVRELLRRNFPTMPFEMDDGTNVDGKYGWKHGFMSNADLTNYARSTDEIIVTVRDLWTWLWSTYQHSYTRGMDPRHMTFSEFLRAPYTYGCFPPTIVDCVSPMEEAPNFIQLRTAKYRQWLQYPRSSLLRMEDLRPTEQQQRIEAIVRTPRTNVNWVSINGYAKYNQVKGRKFTPMTREQALNHYTADDIAFVRREMNATFEEKVLGYSLLPQPPIRKRGSLPIVIMAHKRVEYMKQTMESIDASDVPPNTPIIVSHDGHVPEMMAYLDSIDHRFNITRVYHPWACYDHPHSFPGDDAALNEGYAGDQYGNPRSDWATCAKHHWWWMMQTVWDMGYDTIFFTEEDYEVAPTIFQTIQTGLELCKDDCFGVLVQPNGREVGDVWVEEAFQTGPMVLRRSSWEALWKARKEFCEFDDYGWDWSVVHTMAVGKVPYKVVAPGKRQVRHIGAEGMHGREVVRAKLEAFGGTELRPGGARRPAKHRGNGGWGHPKDHAHCLDSPNRREGEPKRPMPFLERLAPSIPTAPLCPQLRWQPKRGYEHNAFSGAVLYNFNRGLALDSSKIQVSLGGEEIPDVLGRSEAAEYPRYSHGAVTLPTQPNIQTRWYQRDFLQSAIVGDPKSCDSRHTMAGTTVMVQRYEYANLWHTMTDWFNLFWTMEHLGGNVERIVFLDGHAKGALDEVWHTVFAPEVHFVKQLPQQKVCFEHVILLPKATPLWDKAAPSECIPSMDRFVARVLSRYGVSRPTSGPKDEVAIKRGFYLAHPRVKRTKKVERGGWVPGEKQIPFHELTFKQQLETVVNAKSFSGIHGAGLTHLIWMGQGTKLIEWMPPSHRNVNLFKFIATWRPGVTFERKPTSQLRSLFEAHKAQELEAARAAKAQPPSSSHRLAVVIPFREDGGRDPLAQGIGREQNLKEFEAYMCGFLKVPADIFVVEQSPRGTWNKGKLFNVGYHLSKRGHDYMVLHDVDQIPENPENDYSWRDKPALLCAVTSQWDYQRRNPGVVGGALQISHTDYVAVGGYSNVFEGWGREDDNMALRLKKHMGYDILSSRVGRYKELNHQRVWGLDETEQFKKNYRNSNDMEDGVQSVQYAVKLWTNTSCGAIRIHRVLVDLL